MQHPALNLRCHEGGVCGGRHRANHGGSAFVAHCLGTLEPFERFTVSGLGLWQEQLVVPPIEQIARHAGQVSPLLQLPVAVTCQPFGRVKVRQTEQHCQRL